MLFEENRCRFKLSSMLWSGSNLLINKGIIHQIFTFQRSCKSSGAKGDPLGVKLRDLLRKYAKMSPFNRNVLVPQHASLEHATNVHSNIREPSSSAIYSIPSDDTIEIIRELSESILRRESSQENAHEHRGKSNGDSVSFSILGQFLHLCELFGGFDRKYHPDHTTVSYNLAFSQKLQEMTARENHFLTADTVSNSDCTFYIAYTAARLVRCVLSSRSTVQLDLKCRSKFISALCRVGDLTVAGELIIQAAKNRTLKKRDLEPIILHTQNKFVTDYVRRLAKEHDITLEDWVYGILLQPSTQDGDAAEIHELLTEMQDDHPIMDPRNFEKLKHVSHYMSPTLCRNESQISKSSNVAPNSAEKAFVSRRTLHGFCNVCLRPLKLFPFSDNLRAELLRDIQQIPLIRPKSRDVVDRFFSKLRSTPMDIIVDGANVGYSGLCRGPDSDDICSVPERLRPPALVSHREPPTNFHIWFEHIEAILQCAAQHNLRPVVMLHQRHVQRNLLWDKYHSLVARWEKHGLLIPTPNGIEDDICWLYAAVFHSTTLRRVYVVTNDLMRDHHFSLLSRRSFMRWRDTCRVRYKLFPPGTVARLEFPLPYSNTMQFDETSRNWHIPVAPEKPSDEEFNAKWYCVQIASVRK